MREIGKLHDVAHRDHGVAEERCSLHLHIAPYTADYLYLLGRSGALRALCILIDYEL